MLMQIRYSHALLAVYGNTHHSRLLCAQEEAAVLEHLRGEVQRLWEEGRRAVKAGTEEAFVREQPYMWNSE